MVWGERDKGSGGRDGEKGRRWVQQDLVTVWTWGGRVRPLIHLELPTVTLTMSPWKRAIRWQIEKIRGTDFTHQISKDTGRGARC